MHTLTSNLKIEKPMEALKTLSGIYNNKGFNHWNKVAGPIIL